MRSVGTIKPPNYFHSQRTHDYYGVMLIKMAVLTERLTTHNKSE